MKIYNRRISRSIGISTAALLSIIFYIAIVIVLNLSQNMIDPTGESYSEIYGIAQLILVSLYWILINYFYFSRPGKTGFGTILIYLLFMLLPIIAFSIATLVLINLYPTSDFVMSWNLMTWIVSPTLFWYLPYSYIYFVFGYSISISIFIGICLVFNIFVISLGIILGLIRRSYVQEKAAALRSNQPRFDVNIDGVTDAELVTNIADADSITNEINLSEDDIPTTIREMDETDIINQEIDKVKDQATYAFDTEELPKK